MATYDPNERIYLLGAIKSDPEWNADGNHPLVRRVSWTHKVHRDSLSEQARFGLGSLATLFRPSEEVTRELWQKAVPIDSSAPAPVEVAPVDTTPSDDSVLHDEVAEKAERFIEDRLAKLTWVQMQDLVAGILRAMGYRTRVSAAGPDRGVDIFASPDGLGLQEPRIFVEVKHRPGDTMGSQEIRAFLGGRQRGDKCLYVSTGGFSKDARYEAERSAVPITLISMPQLRELLVEQYEQLDAATRALVPLQRLYWPLE